MAYFEFIQDLRDNGTDEVVVNLAYDVVSAANRLRTHMRDLKQIVDRSMEQLERGHLPGMGDTVVNPQYALDIAMARVELRQAQDRLVAGAPTRDEGWDLAERAIAAGASE